MFATRKAIVSGLLTAVLATAGFAQTSDVWMKIFDGTDLKGWKCRTANWKVDTGVVTGSGSISFNTFLITDSLYGDFHLKLEARMPGTGGYRNSGVVYRGKITNPTNFEVGGYQADISDGYWGSFYHEQGNELPWTPVSNCSPAKNTDWGKLEIIADKDKVTHVVNGKSCWEHSGFKVLDKGIIALQLHNPGDFSVQFKNVFIQPVNNSFTIPPDRAYDKDGNPLFVVGINLAPKAARNAGRGVGGNLGLGTSLYDASGRLLPLFGSPGTGESIIAAKAGYGKYFTRQ
ncbi:MAG: hypothetical protein JWO30_1510 [Fibrobacteres bacterium]|nr:hypothetical protein [Fibrobacterota bacterium]